MKTILRLLTIATLTFFMSACGGSSGGGSSSESGGGDTTADGYTKTGTITATIDGSTKTFYTSKVDNPAGIVNSAIVTPGTNYLNVTIQAHPVVGLSTSGEVLTITILFPNGTLTTGTPESASISYMVDGGFYTSAFPTVNIAVATQNGSTIHLEGTAQATISTVDSSSSKTVSIEFVVDADEAIING